MVVTASTSAEHASQGQRWGCRLRLIVLLGTLFYFGGVLATYPHLEAWALHLGCLVVLVLGWRFASNPRRHFTVIEILCLPTVVALILMGRTDVERATRELNAESKHSEVDRLGEDQIDELCTAAKIGDRTCEPALLEIVRSRSAGWGRAAYALLRLTGGDKSSDKFFLAGHRSWICRRDPWGHILGFDYLGMARTRFNWELEHRAVAEEARACVLGSLAPKDAPSAAQGR